MPAVASRSAACGDSQDVVDADAVVLLPGAGLVVPERVDAGAGMAGAHRVRQAEIDERPVGGARFGLEQRILGPGLGVLRIGGFGNDVVVADQQERFLQLSKSAVRSRRRCIQASL